MLSSRQKAIRLTALSRAVSGSASSEEPGMRVSLAYGNREISEAALGSRAMGRRVKADAP